MLLNGGADEYGHLKMEKLIFSGVGAVLLVSRTAFGHAWFGLTEPSLRKEVKEYD